MPCWAGSCCLSWAFYKSKPWEEALSECPKFTQGVCDRQWTWLSQIALQCTTKKIFLIFSKLSLLLMCPRALWWMRDEHQGAPHPLLSIPGQERLGFRCDAGSQGAPWELVGTLPSASAKPAFYLHHAALPHSLSNVWTNWGINSALMLVGKKWKLSFCQTRIYFQLYLKGSHPKSSGPLSNKVYDNRFNFY